MVPTGVGMANALEHRSKRASKRVQKKLGAAAQKRWQGKSLTDDAKIDAINQGKISPFCWMSLAV